RCAAGGAGRVLDRRRAPRPVAPEPRAGRRRRADGRGHLRAPGHALPDRRGAGGGQRHGELHRSGEVRRGRPDHGLDHALPRRRARAGGGALMDVGISALQATRCLTGEEPVDVSAMASCADPVKYAAVDQTMAWTTRLPGGVLAHCATSYGGAGMQSMRVNCERGWFELDPAFFYDGNRGRRSDGVEIAYPSIDLFAAELDDFALSILEGRPARLPGEEGLRDVRIMQAIYESARSGRSVRLAD